MTFTVASQANQAEGRALLQVYFWVFQSFDFLSEISEVKCSKSFLINK